MCLGLLLPGLALIAHAQQTGPIVILIGVPGSGKTEQASILNRERNMPVISADELIARNPQAFEKARESPISGFNARLDPAMNGLVEAALLATDLSKGVILSGYPASTAQGEFLTGLRARLNLPRAIVIHLRVPDDVLRKTLTKDRVSDVEQQIINYHRELDFAHVYFPKTDLHDINGNRKADEVAKDIRKLLPK